MSDDTLDGEHARPTVFLSYASEDRSAARQIGDALAANGLEAWFDESELGGGDAWDQKIRKQIRDCDYFMALISAQTEARHEGYFRREWRLAVERTLDMADDHTFLLPIVIDATSQDGARVPEKFLSVQWLKVPGGAPTPGLEALCRRLAAGQAPAAAEPRKPLNRPRAQAAASYPEFPREEPGQKIRFWADVIGWLGRSAWISFKRLPRWARILASVWICIALMSRACTTEDHEPRQATRAQVGKIKEIADQYKGNNNPADIAKLGTRIAQEFVNDADKAGEHAPFLVVPFSAPAGDAEGTKRADSVFAEVYGRVAIAHPHLVELSKTPLSANDPAAVTERGRDAHSTYTISGGVEASGAASKLTIKIGKVADDSVVWAKSYPADTAPEKIAAELNAKIGDLDD